MIPSAVWHCHDMQPKCSDLPLSDGTTPNDAAGSSPMHIFLNAPPLAVQGLAIPAMHSITTYLKEVVD